MGIRSSPLVLTFSASVKVDLVVKIGAGWLSVDVHCGFFMELREEFTIPVRNPGIPAWAPARPAVGPGAPAQPAVGLEAMPLYEEAVFTAASLIEAAVEPRPFHPLPLMAWDPIGIPDFERGELRLLFRPQFTVATIENAAGNKEQFAYCVALLFLKTAGVGGQRPNPTNLKEPTDFDRMAQAMLLWAINPVDVSAFILSTLADAPITISIAPNLFETHPLEMLRLLWRSNLLRSGGYYLYYRIQAGETVAGLPDEIFENEVGKITILIRFAFRAKEVLPFVNRAVVGETTATGDKLFATSLKKLASIRLRSTTRIAEILEQYRVSVYDLAKAIGEVTLQQGIRLEFEGWSHQVARGETWDKIGKRYSMSGQAVREANGNPTDEPAAYSVITIPKISFLTEDGETLRSIANTFKNHGISPLAELVWQNAQRVAFAIPGAETLEILVWEQLSVRLPMQPPGHAGFVVRRRMPVVNDQVTPSLEEQLNYLYSILGCRVMDNPKFNGSVEAPSDGPKVLSDEPVESLPRTPPDPACQYTKVIPCFKFSKAPRVQAPPLIDPERNPYRGVGETLTVRFDWLDGFGNKTFSPFNPPPDPPPNKQKGNDIFLLRLGYTDELIGVERWPAVSVGYSVRPDEQDSAKIYVHVNLDFDVSRYAPHDGGERSEADAKRTAKADLETFRRIFYQLTWGTTRVLLHTTLDNQSGILESGLPGVPPEQSAQRALIGFVVSIINYLAAVIDPKHVFHYTDFRPTEADPERYLVDIATELHVPLDALQRLNPGLPPRLTTDTIILIPELPFPAGVRLSRRVSLSNPAELFPLVVNLTLERLGRVDDGFLDAQDVAGNPAEEDGFLDQPSVKFATSLLDPLSIAGGNSGRGLVFVLPDQQVDAHPGVRQCDGSRCRSPGLRIQSG